MLTRFTVAAFCLLLLTTSSFAKDIVEVEQKIIIVSTTDGQGEPQVIELRAFGEGPDSAKKLANLVAELVDSGELSTAGAAKLKAFVAAIGTKFGGNVRGGNFGAGVVFAPGHGENVEARVLKMVGEADGKPQVFALKVFGDAAGLQSDGFLTEELIAQIKELKEARPDKEGLAIELKMLFEERAGEFGNLQEIREGQLKKLFEFKLEGLHEGKLKELHGIKLKELQQVELKGLKEKLMSLSGADGHAYWLEKLASPQALGSFGHEAEFDKWFSEWDNILEDLAVDLSAVQLDRIQGQLDKAEEHLDKMGGMHNWQGGGMLYGPGGEGGVGTLAPGGRHSFEMFMSGPEPGEGHNFMFAPGLQQGENFEFVWFGKDGESPFNIDKLMEEIEKMVKELVEERLAE